MKEIGIRHEKYSDGGDLTNNGVKQTHVVFLDGSLKVVDNSSLKLIMIGRE